MQIDIILEPDLSPAQVAEIAVAAENYGFRTLWHSNYHQNPDAFVALVPAALATKKIRLGILAISPYEMHPLKIANATQTLNEISNGRTIVAIGGGGSVMGAIGMKLDPKANRMLQSVREAVDIVSSVTAGKLVMNYAGEVFQLSRPLKNGWAKAARPGIFTCATGPKMLQLAGEIADGTQMSDVTPEKIGHHMEALRAGLAARKTPHADFRIGNFWAGTSRPTARNPCMRRVASWCSAANCCRRSTTCCPTTPEERQLVIDKWQNFAKAFWTAAAIEDVPESIVTRLIAACSSAGDLGDIDLQIERFRVFEKAGLTELSIRLFDEPMAGLKIVAEHVLPKFERA
ncbi:MAG: LLM class flavin-dependent oxidoreductase [Gammaproteobacteria bacterium]